MTDDLLFAINGYRVRYGALVAAVRYYLELAEVLYWLQDELRDTGDDRIEAAENECVASLVAMEAELTYMVGGV